MIKMLIYRCLDKYNGHARTSVNLEKFLSETNQKEKRICFMIPLTGNIQKRKK